MRVLRPQARSYHTEAPAFWLLAGCLLPFETVWEAARTEGPASPGCLPWACFPGDTGQRTAGPAGVWTPEGRPHPSWQFGGPSVEWEGSHPGHPHPRACRRAGPTPEPHRAPGPDCQVLLFLRQISFPKKKGQRKGRGTVSFIFNKMPLAVCEAALCQL